MDERPLDIAQEPAPGTASLGGRSAREIYGDDSALLAAQTERYARARQGFVAAFGSGPSVFLRTPGRINLIGEHTDYNGGFVLPVALDRDVLFLYRPRTDAVVRVVNVEDGYSAFSFELSAQIPPASHGDWSNYFRGAGQEICRCFADHVAVRGMDVLVSGSPPFGVPRGSGLSSSTALTVAVALALVTRNEIDIERADLAHLCSEAEWYVGTRGGMMDQFSALLSRRDYALFLDCRPSAGGVYTLDHVPVPAGIQIVLLNSGVRHENVRGEFNQRVAECKIGVRLLQTRYPSVDLLRDVTPEALGVGGAEFWATIHDLLPAQATAGELVHCGLDEDWLHDLMADHRLDPGGSFAVLPRCRHVLSENARVLDGVAALRGGHVKRFGELMDAAHASMSKDYGASCPEVDALAEIARRQAGVLGARITGAGWGGGVVALVRRGLAETWIEDIRAAYHAATGLTCTVYVCRPGAGAGLVHDARLSLDG
jgi:galactokinase